MFDEKERHKINTIIKDEVFQFETPYFGGNNEFAFYYEFKLVGQKQMISVGEYYMYELVDVEIVDMLDGIKKFLNVMYANLDDKDKLVAYTMKREYIFMNSLERSIGDYLSYFTSDSYSRIKINNISLSDKLYEEIKNSKF